VENKKRCPKCGEENPPEAVMCWACYTPLSGAAGASASKRSANSSAQAADDDDAEDRKPAAQPWQIAVIAIGLIFALFWVGKNFLPSGSGEDTLPTASAPGEMPPPGQAPAPAAPASTSTGTSNTTAVPPQKLPFTIAVSPNPNITVGTMAIVPTTPNISTSQAASLAAFTRSQFSQMKRWNKLYIYVFRDQQSAKQFADYQRPRRGAPLSDGDYRNLTTLWNSALSCYVYNNGNDHVYTPSNNPSGWWAE
jgi:hypothetical protein